MGRYYLNNVASQPSPETKPEAIFDRLIEQANGAPDFLSEIAETYLQMDTPDVPIPRNVITLAEGIDFSEKSRVFRIIEDHKIAYRTRNLVSMDVMASPAAGQAIFHRLGRVLNELAGMSLGAEFSADPSISAAFRHIIDRGTSKARPQDQISRFQQRRFGNARAIGDQITNGNRNFDDLLELIGKKKRFSAWLKQQDLTQELFDEYMAEMAHGTWLEHLPTKTARFALFTGGGIYVDALLTATTGVPFIGTAGGIVLGALDSFLVDRITKNWSPHQFINGPLADFVSGSGRL